MANLAKAEWLNANTFRAYPLADSTGGVPGTLPSQLLVDMLLLYEGAEIASASVSRISKTLIEYSGSPAQYTPTAAFRCSLSLRIIKTDGAVETIDDFVSFDSNTEFGTEIPFVHPLSGLIIKGTVTVGYVSSLVSLPVETEISETGGELHPGVVHQISLSSGVESINGLTGDITIQAGDGIVIEVVGNVINISSSGYNIEHDNSILSDKELLDALQERFGIPITTINGVEPVNGNMTFGVRTATDGCSNVEVITAQAADGAIYLEMQKDPCIDDANIQKIVENLSNLNARCADVEAGVRLADTGINALAAQLARL